MFGDSRLAKAADRRLPQGTRLTVRALRQKVFVRLPGMPSASARPRKATIEQAYGISLILKRAVMDGRAAQVIEFAAQTCVSRAQCEYLTRAR